MKFSHSIQLNAVPDWMEEYIAYSNLKKLIYSIEKATLGIQESPMTSDFRRPSRHECSSQFSSALDEQLSKIVAFYKKTEHGLYLKLEHYFAELTFAENYETSRQHDELMSPQSILVVDEGSRGRATSVPRQASHQRLLERRSLDSRKSMPEMEADSSSMNHQIPPPPLSQNLSFQGTENNYNPSWTLKSMKRRKKQLTSACIELYVSLSNLCNYVELNYTGFSKILKKFDKVTGSRLKRAYLSKVDQAYPFTNTIKSILKDKINKVAQSYARMVTEGRLDLAVHDLDSHLREQIVWERNTIWRDMIEQERRTTAAGVSKQTVRGGQAKSVVPEGPVTFCGCTFTLPSFINTSTFMLLTSLVVFILLLVFPIFSNSPEQSNCFAILILASMLWAFEIVPLFVTSILIPFLVVILRVLRQPVYDSHGDIDHYTRLEAKHAAKLVFSAMFSPVIMLLLGGFSLAAALSKHHIAKGMASFVLLKAGSEPYRVILANMFVSSFASMWISNVAAPVLCFELVKPILRNLPHRSPYARSLILGIAMAANVGGMASPIASPQNIIAIGNIFPAPTWPEWFLISLPVATVIILCIWVTLLIMYKPGGSGETVISPPEMFNRHVSEQSLDESTPLLFSNTGVSSGPDSSSMTSSSAFGGIVSSPTGGGEFNDSSDGGNSAALNLSRSHLNLTTMNTSGWSRTQIFIIVVTLFTILLWCIESAFEHILGDMGVIAIIPMVAFFGSGILTKEDFNNFLWTVIILAMGGISLGKAVELSGLLEEITNRLVPLLVDLSPFKCLLVISGVIGVATTFISHTVGAMIILPIVRQIGENLPHPMGRTLVMGGALMCSCAMGLPVSSFPNMNAISQEDPTGVPWLRVSDFMRIGILSTVISYICVNSIAYGIMTLMGFE